MFGVARKQVFVGRRSFFKLRNGREVTQRQLSDEITPLYYWNSYTDEDRSTDCKILVGNV